ncbi:tetratricopeptide repeat protein, partial [Mesorhizobium sp.]|uniref:tetratricopeptide repeat protein n=1 Tax=Mesorhizobium sp. TaxID=1871066 RepID=UPI00257DB788
MLKRYLSAACLVLSLSISARADDARDAYEKGDFATALELFQPRADKGDPEAEFHIGRMYHFGQGAIKKDLKKAAEWYSKSADQRFARAQNNLAVLYVQGDGVPKDVAKAVELYRKAADQGFAHAQTNLANAFRWGQGVPQDHGKAAELYRKAADQGFAPA